MAALTSQERLAGCLLGGALGDALGAHFEGRPTNAAFLIPLSLHITDDTQLTLATCEAIVEAGKVCPAAVADHFTRWYRERRLTGLGSSTLKALRDLDAGGHWALAGASGDRAAGNGAAMRIAPLAFVLNPRDADQRRTVRDICRITHRNDEAYLGALVVLFALRHILSGNMLDLSFLAELTATLPDSRLRDRLRHLVDPLPQLTEYAARFGCSGYVVDTVPLAVLAAIGCSDSMQTLQQLIALGGDTDTVASLFGQLHGAAHGPAVWLPDLLGRIIEMPDVQRTITQFAADLPGLA